MLVFDSGFFLCKRVPFCFLYTVVSGGVLSLVLGSKHKWFCFSFLDGYVHYVKVHKLMFSGVCFWCIKNEYVYSCSIMGGKDMLLAYILLRFSLQKAAKAYG